MVMYGYVGLCMAVYGCVWLCIAMYGCVALCTAIERNVFHILANGEPLYDAYTTYLPYLPIFLTVARYLILRGNVRRPRIDRYNERKRYPTNFITDYLSEIV